MMPGMDQAEETRVTAPAATASSSQGRLSMLALTAGAGGNLLEWYDFGVYGLLAPLLAGVFFPPETAAPH
jgi:MHS family proline/betaine transporter-like MFS transporter